ncbi:MAG TPA: methylamine utilization protein [Dyella sp.]|uniref:methylamine utilization protein n=1 Tax=Dyella sp. TaxID=1869338 RepID=UPI002D78EA95|nr:methylamine utilization protein [Dyella sp.]HET6555436.1 methylamine utilization protein [Dyella sp.]
MRWLLGVVIASMLLAVQAASAGDLSIRVQDDARRPVGDAVATLEPDVPAAAPHMPSASRIVDQKNETFVPYVQVLRPGDTVVFRNSDATRHHVYSFSPVKSFELVLAPGERSAALTLDKPGIAAVGCNIHDHMLAYLYVSDAPNIGVSGPDGVIGFASLPPGRYTLHVWHPQLHPGQAELTQVIQVAGNAPNPPVSVTLSLLPDPRMRMDREHMGY